MEKPAETQYPVLDVIKRRWSPRAFSPDRPVEPQKLRRCFEAARWAASSFNEQPWRFLVATREDKPRYDRVLSCLVETNQKWAQTAPVIGLTCISTKFQKNDKPNRVAFHDLGLAMGNLTLQATDMGLFVHQMAGVDLDKIRETFHVPDDFEPQTAFAIGYPGDTGQLPEDWMREAEQAPRDRMDFNDFVFGDDFAKPSGLF